MYTPALLNYHLREWALFCSMTTGACKDKCATQAQIQVLPLPYPAKTILTTL